MKDKSQPPSLALPKTVDTSTNPRETLSQANQATAAAEEKFKLLIESIKDYGIFLIDPNGFIQSWNPGAERIKGYKSEEVINKHFSIFYTPEDIRRNHPQHELEVALREGHYEEEGWRVKKDGKRFWANIIITNLKNSHGEHVGFAKVTRDLTDKKLAEENLRLSEVRARKMFEDIKDYAVILLNPDGTISSWNEGARRIKGYNSHEIIAKHFSIFYTDQEVQMGKCEYELQEAMLTGRFEDEGWRVRKDGTKFWASVLITAVKDDDGNLLGFSKVTRDITDRKRADDLLKMSNHNLEKRVEERTKELVATNDKLTDAVRIRDEFLSIASHELRTPLTPLKLQIQSLISSVKKGTIQLNEERLEKIAITCEKSVSRLSSLIDNLLDVSRINMGKLALNYEIFDLAEMGEDLIERYKDDILASRSKVTFQATEPVIGHFDRLRMEQVFLNLLTNALKYGNQNPIDITISAKNQFVTLMVKDSGIGISTEHQEKVFERFERVDSNINIAGLGLGLYITRQIVSAHGGIVEVESVLGQGSVFKVIIPIKE